jgi:hypothetical protein
LIAKVSKGNKDIEEKIKFHMKETLKGMSDNTDKELTDKVQSAIKLSIDADTQGMFDGGIGGNGGSGIMKITYAL